MMRRRRKEGDWAIFEQVECDLWRSEDVGCCHQPLLWLRTSPLVNVTLLTTLLPGISCHETAVTLLSFRLVREVGNYYKSGRRTALWVAVDWIACTDVWCWGVLNSCELLALTEREPKNIKPTLLLINSEAIFHSRYYRFCLIHSE